MFGDGLPGGSFHNDVLTAQPTDEAGRLTLLEEIKKRAKGSVGSRNYPEAVQLYSKGIELYPQDAVLHANRSMCHLGTSHTRCDSICPLVSNPSVYVCMLNVFDRNGESC